MSKIVGYILAGLLLVVFALGCGPKEHTEVDASIAGTVVDGVDGTPVDSARVLLSASDVRWGEVYKSEQVTDADGTFSFRVSPRYLHVLEVAKNGYVGVTLRVECGVDLDIALYRAELVDRLPR
ncbi:MAG: carboxypeptidase regulatory-like domain-containing protein [Candidatus Eisenbacteria bacterium]|nr:carboxypeptidase regulatory-like domain-containing protein [Candidatus Eisenbacteria bacterium]